MTYNFSSMSSLYDTLNDVMYDYEEEGNENALEQFFHAVTEASSCPQTIGRFHIYIYIYIYEIRRSFGMCSLVLCNNSQCRY